MDLGLQFIPMEQIIKESVESLKSKGFISWMPATGVQEHFRDLIILGTDLSVRICSIIMNNSSQWIMVSQCKLGSPSNPVHNILLRITYVRI